MKKTSSKKSDTPYTPTEPPQTKTYIEISPTKQFYNTQLTRPNVHNSTVTINNQINYVSQSQSQVV